MRYAPQTILNACCIGSALRSNPGAFGTSGWTDVDRVADEVLGLEGQEATDAVELFTTAWLHVCPLYEDPNDVDLDGEAEALLRSGWLPEQGMN